MPLTPEDVSNKRFTAVRLREGYDMGEVDAFLDEVETELTRLHAENAELKAKLEALGGQGAPAATGTPVSAEGTTTVIEAGGATQDATARTDTAAAPAAPAADSAADGAADGAADTTADTPVASLAKPGGTETLRVSTTAEASAAATRLLELATRSAEELMVDAQQQADTVLSSARADADRLQQEARGRAQQLDVETTQRREQLFSSLDRDRSALASEVESLRAFEREYRAELKDYFTKQLDALEHPLAQSERFGTASDPTGTRVAEAPSNGSTSS